jgi:hypothetical protein
MAGVAFVDAAAGNRLDNEFLHQINELRYIRQPKIIAQTNNPGPSLDSPAGFSMMASCGSG